MFVCVCPFEGVCACEYGRACVGNSERERESALVLERDYIGIVSALPTNLYSM